MILCTLQVLWTQVGSLGWAVTLTIWQSWWPCSILRFQKAKTTSPTATLTSSGWPSTARATIFRLVNFYFMSYGLSSFMLGPSFELFSNLKTSITYMLNLHIRFKIKVIRLKFGCNFRKFGPFFCQLFHNLDYPLKFNHPINKNKRVLLCCNCFCQPQSPLMY